MVHGFVGHTGGHRFCIQQSLAKWGLVFWFDGALAMVSFGLDGDYAERFDLVAPVVGRCCFGDSNGEGKVSICSVDRQFSSAAIA